MDVRQVAVRTAIRAMTWQHGTYQPVKVGGVTISKGRRGTDQRFDSMLPLLRHAGVRSVVDHGCAEGYIVRRCAESGIYAVGIETSRRALAVGQLSLLADGVAGWGLSRAHLDLDTIQGLPTFDATVTLSVMHHVMYQEGLEYASRMLKAIRTRTKKMLVIEVGQSNETAFSWSRRLPDMGADPHSWIAAWIKSCGFSETQLISKVQSFNSNVERATFAAYCGFHDDR